MLQRLADLAALLSQAGWSEGHRLCAGIGYLSSPRLWVLGQNNMFDSRTFIVDKFYSLRRRK